MQEEVIAKRASALLASYIVVLVCGALMILLGIFPLIGTYQRWRGLIMLLCGLVLVGTGTGCIVWVTRTPKKIIKFVNGKLILHDGTAFSPSEVDYCTSCAYWTGYGPLTVSVAHKEYKYKFVSDVDRAANRINRLKMLYLQIEAVQQHIAERNAAQNGAAEETKGNENNG